MCMTHASTRIWRIMNSTAPRILSTICDAAVRAMCITAAMSPDNGVILCVLRTVSVEKVLLDLPAKNKNVLTQTATSSRKMCTQC